MRQSAEENSDPSHPRGPRVWRTVLAVAVWGLLCLILLAYNHYPGRLALQIGKKSPRDVFALRTVTYIDPEETRRLKEESARREEPIFSRIPAAPAEAENSLRVSFERLKDAAGHAIYEAETAALLKSLPGVSRGTLGRFLSATREDQQQLEESAIRLLREEMGREIRDDDSSLSVARAHARQAAERQFRSWRDAELVGALLAVSLRANRRQDVIATANRRKEAMAEVKGVERPLQAGDLVVLKGERVGSHHMAMLRALGLISPWSGGGWLKGVALSLLVLLGVLFLGVSAQQFSPATYASLGRLTLLGLLVCTATFLFNLFMLPLPNIAMLFLPTSTLVIAVLLSRQVAVAAAIVESLLAGLAAGGSLTLALPALGSCMAAVISADYIWPPSRLVRASIQLALANLALTGAAGTLTDLPWADLGKAAGMAAGYGAAAPLLALGAIFLLEKPFDITSHVRLLELSNPREPLLHRLQAEAPGTYYSSLIVSNLAEASAQVISADPLLTRVGAIYHDIGKLRRPGLFVENQFLLGTENAHSRLSPYLSALVIQAHVRDGVEFAQRYGLPRVIQQIILEHHGTGLVSYFYHKACANQSGPPPEEMHYRYEGYKPRSKESGIIMLADAVQAAAKSLTEPNPEKMESLVEGIIAERLQDGQLQDSEFTFRDLKLIKESFLRSLQGLHLHTRVEYPTLMRILGEGADTNHELTEESAEPSRPQASRPNRHAG